MVHRSTDFKNSAVYSLIILNVMFGTFASLIPTGSLTIFLLNMGLTIIEVAISWHWWRTIPNEVRYTSLVCYLMSITFGIFATIPLLRLTFGTMLFWLILLLYLMVLGYSIYLKELLFQAFHRPGKSKLSKGIAAFLLVLIIIGALSSRNGQEMLILSILNDHQGAIFVSLFSFIIGLFVTFTASSLLKKPEEIKG
ncbi:MAG: hypothetical protein QJR05_07555 [Thermoanaerobacterium sp.]|nr:hypothetical protein [Thermoanaerobacterium sp.]